MSKTIANYDINRVCIIDDEEENRIAFELLIEDSDLEPLTQDERVTSLETFFSENIKPGDAILSDHHLKKKNYFPVTGAQVIATCYDRKIPSVLVTKYEQAEINEIRQYRDKIPVILTPDEVNTNSLEKSFEIFIKEINGEKGPKRKLWRTLIRIDDIADPHFYVLIPAWNPNETISLTKKDLPKGAFEKLQTDMRLYAHVNIGADSANDLYFTKWEI